MVIESLDIDLCRRLVCSYGREYFVSGCLKQDEVPGNGVFHTLDLEKVFSFRGPQKAPGPPLSFQAC